jgi:hypothetical protein
MVAGNDDGAAYVIRLPDFKLLQTIQAHANVCRQFWRFISDPTFQLTTSVSFIPQSNECMIFDQLFFPNSLCFTQFSLLVPIVFGADIKSMAKWCASGMPMRCRRKR